MNSHRRLKIALQYVCWECDHFENVPKPGSHILKAPTSMGKLVQPDSRCFSNLSFEIITFDGFKYNFHEILQKT